MFEIEADEIEVEVRDDVITIALNRPSKHNALNEPLVDAFHSLMMELTQNPPEKALLLTGRGESFCSGADTRIAVDGETPSDPDFSRKVHRIDHMVQTYPRPTVVAARGACIGQGAHMSLETDFMVVGDETHYHYNEVELGMFSDRVVKTLMHNFGAQIAREVVLKSEPIEPDRLYDLGIATEVVSEDEVEDTALELAQRLSGFRTEPVKALLDTVQFEINLGDRKPVYGNRGTSAHRTW